MGLLWQLYATCSICLLSMIMGLMFAWPSSTLQLFESDTNTTLARAMTPTELSLFGSVSSIGALIGTPIFGYALDIIGRKYCAVISGFFYVIAWSLIAACRHVEVILTAVFLSGFGGSVILIAPVYVSEICQDSVRGALTSGSVIFYGIGILLSYVLGGYMSYYGNIYVQLTLSIIYIVLVSVLKDSPVFLLKKGYEEEAAKSIAFYRSTESSSKEVLEEMYKLKRILNPHDEGGYRDEELKLNEDSKPQTIATKQSPWSLIWKSRSTKRGLLVTLVLITSSIFMGLVTLQVYAEPLFKTVAPNLSSNLCSIMFAVVTLVANLIAAYLTDIAGRRVLMIGSALASGLTTLLLAMQLEMRLLSESNTVTAILIYLFCVSFSLGSGTIPYVLVAEVFLPEVKSFCSMLVVEWAWLTNFLLLFVFFPLVEWIGLGAVFYIFSSICFATGIFSIFFLPETKGLPADLIQLLFSKKRKRDSGI